MESSKWSIPVLISAAHGGHLKPTNYRQRDCDNNTDWTCTADSYTRDLSEVLAARFGEGFNKCPWMVINHLHRSRLDANREVAEAAGGDANAAAAHAAFHSFIALAQSKINALHGNDGSGIKGVLLDLHGYVGADYHTGGSPYAMFGYRLSASTLQQDVLPDSPSGGLTHARFRLGADSLERLVRGELSMGARVPQVSIDLVVGDMPSNCGAASKINNRDPPPPRKISFPTFLRGHHNTLSCAHLRTNYLVISSKSSSVERRLSLTQKLALLPMSFCCMLSGLVPGSLRGGMCDAC